MERTITFAERLAERYIQVTAELSEKAAEKAAHDATRTFWLSGLILAPNSVTCEGVVHPLKEVEAIADVDGRWLYVTVSGPDFECVVRAKRGLYPRQFVARLNSRAKVITSKEAVWTD
jgi:hypothetical protein